MESNGATLRFNKVGERTGQRRSADAMSGVDRSILAGLEPFAGWPAADLDALLAPAHARRFDKGAALFEQGAAANSFFLLLDGHVQASKLTSDGRQIIVRYINPGELFGIAAQIRETTYPATAKAVVESLALAWPSSIWPELAAKFPALSSGLLQSVGARLADANARVMEMATEPVERRLARAAAQARGASGRSVDGGVEIDFPVTRQDLGEMIGATLFTVSRAAQRLGGRRPGRKRPGPHRRAPPRPPSRDRRGRRSGMSASANLAKRPCRRCARSLPPASCVQPRIRTRLSRHCAIAAPLIVRRRARPPLQRRGGGTPPQ